MFKHTQIARYQAVRLETDAEVAARSATDTYRWPHTVPDGQIDAVIEIEIDITSIVRTMGQKATRSKGGKCVDGYVTVRAHSITKVQS